jgi:hypothetical protein
MALFFSVCDRKYWGVVLSTDCSFLLFGAFYCSGSIVPDIHVVTPAGGRTMYLCVCVCLIRLLVGRLVEGCGCAWGGVILSLFMLPVGSLFYVVALPLLLV